MNWREDDNCNTNPSAVDNRQYTPHHGYDEYNRQTNAVLQNKPTNTVSLYAVNKKNKPFCEK